MIFEASAADELAEKAVARNKSRVDGFEPLEGRQDEPHFFMSADVVGNIAHQLGNKAFENSHLAHKRRVEYKVGLVFVGGDILFLALAHICPHPEGLACRGAAELMVAQGAAAQPHPCPFKDDLARIVDNVAAGRDIDPECVGGKGREGIVQRMDALEDDYVALFGIKEASGVELLALLFEKILGKLDGLAPFNGGKVPSQQLHVEA